MTETSKKLVNVIHMLVLPCNMVQYNLLFYNNEWKKMCSHLDHSHLKHLYQLTNKCDVYVIVLLFKCLSFSLNVLTQHLYLSCLSSPAYGETWNSFIWNSLIWNSLIWNSLIWNSLIEFSDIEFPDGILFFIYALCR